VYDPDDVTQYVTSRIRRKAYKKNNHNILTRRGWELVKEYFNNRCAYCGRDNVQLEREHIIPVSKGGELVVENIVPACRRCNNKKGDRTPEEAGMGIRVWGDDEKTI